MNDNKEAPMSDHNYDGITELDNNLPQWWVWLFILCCVWAAGYMMYYHMMGGPTQLEKYTNEMIAAAPPEPIAPPPGTEVVTAAPAVDEPSTDAAVLAHGKELFLKNCMVCHTADGGGLIGPNMTDDYFIHGPQFSDSVRIINEGVLAKGMISWKAILKQEEIYAVASYVYTLRGTTPAVAKAPEGTQTKM